MIYTAEKCHVILLYYLIFLEPLHNDPNMPQTWMLPLSIQGSLVTLTFLLQTVFRNQRQWSKVTVWSDQLGRKPCVIWIHLIWILLPTLWLFGPRHLFQPGWRWRTHTLSFSNNINPESLSVRHLAFLFICRFHTQRHMHSCKHLKDRHVYMAICKNAHTRTHAHSMCYPLSSIPLSLLHSSASCSSSHLWERPSQLSFNKLTGTSLSVRFLDMGLAPAGLSDTVPY